ncbi:ABC transporter permease [candidate division KSB1 bacterium]|nr:ABC transporter permease [candidate division KSB1 bacterium]
MHVGESIRLSLTAIRANKLRSLLTLLGIIIGVMTIITMQSLVSGLRNSINQQVSMLGSNVFQVQKWPAIHTGGDDFRRYRNRKNITLDEYEAVKRFVTAARFVGAEYWQGGQEIRCQERKTLPTIAVVGCTPEFLNNNGYEMAEGRFITQQDVDLNRQFAAIGADVARQLFPYEDPLGKEIKIAGKRFQVIGVLQSRGNTFGQSRDGYVTMPIGSFVKIYGKERSLNITVQAQSAELYNTAMEQTIGVMRIVRKVPPGQENDFDIFSNDTLIDFFDNLTRYVRIVAVAIASISLLVAGIGIMNIMLVSVTERTREIGIRKSIGAKRRDVLLQFLVEAIVLSEVGGLIGILLGLTLAKFVELVSPIPAAVPLWTVVLGLIFCSAVGMIFGVYPATKAARLDPIVALRYE